MPCLRILLLIALAAPGLHPSLDADSDTLPDDLEQQLIARFAPEWMIHADECDALPAEFIPGLREPRVTARNGTIYARAFPHSGSEPRIEIQYFHLWRRDCGAISHELDAEHVSVLLVADQKSAPAKDWRARYWYAAAHEDTLCDRSHAALASTLNAETRGARVWISRGKHASFLDQSLCTWGCGGDRCDRMAPFYPSKLINIGEPGAWMNGTAWVQSAAWGLGAKLRSDFTTSLIARLNPRPLASVNGNDPAVLTAQAVALGSTSTAEALALSNQKTSNALETASASTGEAIGKSADQVAASLAKSATEVGKSLEKAHKSIVRFLRGGAR